MSVVVFGDRAAQAERINKSVSERLQAILPLRD